MASPSDRRRQQAMANQKQRREAAQTTRKRRTEKSSAPKGAASGWPIDEAWISQDWYEWEVVIHAIVTRKHADGTRAYAAFEVDLADGGLTRCKSEVGVGEGNVQQAVVERSQEKAMVLTKPENVARLVNESLDWRRRQKLADPKGLPEALQLLRDVDDEGAQIDFLFGRQDEEEATSEVPARQSIWTRFRSMFS